MDYQRCTQVDSSSALLCLGIRARIPGYLVPVKGQSIRTHKRGTIAIHRSTNRIAYTQQYWSQPRFGGLKIRPGTLYNWPIYHAHPWNTLMRTNTLALYQVIACCLPSVSERCLPHTTLTMGRERSCSHANEAERRQQKLCADTILELASKLP